MMASANRAIDSHGAQRRGSDVALVAQAQQPSRRPLIRKRRPVRPHIAPTRPQAVQTILGHKERTGISYGSPSAFMTAP
jgi:hypothetical protein